MNEYFYYLFIINLLGIVFYGFDKLLAILKKNRISENWLFLVSVVGGALGCIIGMFIFRHKIRKTKFYILNFSMLILWCYVIYFLVI